MSTDAGADAGRAYVGISGWTYAPWRGEFYPKGLIHARELEFAASHLSAIEINGSFYSLQRPSSWLRWKAAVPADFVFAVKGGRYITHILRLRNAEQALGNFWASGVLALGEKLGPLLWQLPATVPFDPDVVRSFFRLLPRTSRSALAMARRHSTLAEDRTWMHTGGDRPLRHALEPRHPSFACDEFMRLARDENVAVVYADTDGRWPKLDAVTSDFTYARMHGDSELYASGYTDAALASWANRLHGWMTGAASPDGRPRDTFTFFDNDVKVRAPYDAIALRSRLAELAPE